MFCYDSRSWSRCRTHIAALEKEHLAFITTRGILLRGSAESCSIVVLMVRGSEFLKLRLLIANSTSHSSMPPSLRAGLLLVLLGLWRASAVRTIEPQTVMKTTDCDYESLREAKVTAVSTGVQVQFCDQEVVLGTDTVQGDAWRALSWWNPSSQGRKLSNNELKTLNDYLGTYGYSRPMGQLGHGLLPSNFEQFRGDKKGKAELVREILLFEAKLGDVLNKLPVTGMAQLFRGGWTSGEQFRDMQAALDSGSSISFPWFQSTTSLHPHALTFMTRKSEPETCAYNCLEQGQAFPTFLTFNTCYAKNVTEWNRREQEWLLLPNLFFKIASITKIQNDPWRLWTPEQMADWLTKEHAVPEDWQRNGKSAFGPWPDVAAAVTAHSMDGEAFLTWFETKDFPEPYVKGKWDTSEHLFSNKRQELKYASWTRFRLPGPQTRMGLGVNSIQYYYNITFEDVGPCPS